MKIFKEDPDHEITILRGLDHENIVKFHDDYQHQTLGRCLIMEYCPYNLGQCQLGYAANILYIIHF